jgi:pyrimidine-nucleoside phosphorylase
MVRLAGLANSDAEAEEKVQTALARGAGLEKFARIIEQQAGDPRIVDNYERLPQAPKQTAIVADRAGYVIDLNAESIGIGAMMLGAGRNRAEDKVDHAVGVIVRAPFGAQVKAGDTILEVHYRDEPTLQGALPMLRGAVRVGDQAPTLEPPVIEVVS